MTARRPPHNLDAEASILGGILLRNDVLNALDSVSTDDFYDPRHRVVYAAMVQLHAELVPIDAVTLEVEVAKSGKLEAIGGVAFIGELALRVPTPDNVAHYAEIVAAKARTRRVMLAAAELIERGYAEDLDAERYLEDAASRIERVTAPPAPKVSPLVSSAQIGDHIRAQSQMPIVPLRLGQEMLEAIPSGQACYFMGGSGDGKTTTALGIAVSHARHEGPVLVASYELDLGVIGGRAGGIITDSSWLDVLRYGDTTERAIAALADIPRLYFIDAAECGMTQISAAVDELCRLYPGETVLLVCDYLQIMQAEQQLRPDSARTTVSSTIAAIRRLRKRVKRIVTLVLSQMSRANATASRAGEKTGKDSADTGAETAAIEQDAALTLATGKRSALQADGSRFVDLNIGKGRFGGGDRVITLKQWGASGLTQIYSDLPADEVRERDAAQRETEAKSKTARQLLDAADKAAYPMTREELCALAVVQKAKGRAVIGDLITSGELVETAQRRPKSSHWLVWSRERAASTGTALRTRDSV